MSKLKDSPDFVDISVIEKDGGIEVKLSGARPIVLNREDAQFLCDNLYVMLDDMDLEEQDGN